MAVLALSLTVLGYDCDDATGPHADLREELEAARARWNSQGYDDYTMELQRDCFCGPDHRGPVLVTVRSGAVVERVYKESGQPVPGDIAPIFPDVEGLFDFLEDALDQDPAEARAEFHAELGYPTSMWIDFATNIADEEQGYTTLSLQADAP